MSQDELLKDLEGAISTPQEVSTDAGTVKQYSLPDKIKALEYLEKKKAEEKAKSSPLGRVRFIKFIRK